MNARPRAGAAEALEQSSERTTLQVRRAIDGDIDSLGWIVEHFSPLLLAQARYRLARHLAGIYDPEDLVQDVWVTAIHKLDQLQSRDRRMTPVLLKFLSHVLLNHYRNLLHKHVHGKPLRVELEGSGTNPLELTVEQTGVLARAVRSELTSRVLACIDGLSEADREIVVLRGIEQCSNRDAALALGIREGTVAVRYHRALQRLREAMPASIMAELTLSEA